MNEIENLYNILYICCVLEACFVFVDNRQQPGTGQAQAMTMLLSVEALSPRAKKKREEYERNGADSR